MRYVERSPVAEPGRAASPHTGLAPLVENTGCAPHPGAWGRWAAGRGRLAAGNALSVRARGILAGPAKLPGRAWSAVPTCAQPSHLSLPSAAGPSRWTVGVPHGIEAAGRNGSLRGGARTKRRTVGYTALPAFLSMENVMPAKPMSEDRPNLPRREVGGRE